MNSNLFFTCIIGTQHIANLMPRKEFMVGNKRKVIVNGHGYNLCFFSFSFQLRVSKSRCAIEIADEKFPRGQNECLHSIEIQMTSASLVTTATDDRIERRLEWAIEDDAISWKREKEKRELGQKGF